MNIDEIKELILLLEKSSISDLEIQQKDFRLCLRKGAYAATPDLNQAGIKSSRENSATVEQEAELGLDNAIEVMSTMVGTFYSAPSPEAETYVKVGDGIEAGQTLCIIEAMKLFNEIKSDFAGTVVDILVENAEPVEYGQTLFIIARG